VRAWPQARHSRSGCTPLAVEVRDAHSQSPPAVRGRGAAPHAARSRYDGSARACTPKISSSRTSSVPATRHQLRVDHAVAHTQGSSRAAGPLQRGGAPMPIAPTNTTNKHSQLREVGEGKTLAPTAALPGRCAASVRGSLRRTGTGVGLGLRGGGRVLVVRHCKNERWMWSSSPLALSPPPPLPHLHRRRPRSCVVPKVQPVVADVRDHRVRH
jgi:hypothetical protein